MTKKCRLLPLYLVLGILVPSFPISAEIYKYIDKNGIIHYTDNMTTIPSEYRRQLEPYMEQKNTTETQKVESLSDSRKAAEKGSTTIKAVQPESAAKSSPVLNPQLKTKTPPMSGKVISGGKSPKQPPSSPREKDLSPAGKGASKNIEAKVPAQNKVSGTTNILPKTKLTPAPGQVTSGKENPGEQSLSLPREKDLSPTPKEASKNIEAKIPAQNKVSGTTNILPKTKLTPAPGQVTSGEKNPGEQSHSLPRERDLLPPDKGSSKDIEAKVPDQNKVSGTINQTLKHPVTDPAPLKNQDKISPADVKEVPKIQENAEIIRQLNETRKNLEEKKGNLDGQYQALLKERERLENYRESLSTKPEIESYNQQVQELNTKIQTYRDQRKSLENEVETFNKTIKE